MAFRDFVAGGINLIPGSFGSGTARNIADVTTDIYGNKNRGLEAPASGGGNGAGGLSVQSYDPGTISVGGQQTGQTLGAQTNQASAGGGAIYGGGSIYSGPTAAQIAAQNAAKANAMKSGITGIIGNIRNVYDAIYGDIGTAAGDKRNAVDRQYQQDVEGLTNEFNGQFPAIGRAFGSRGAYDSSYRMDAENTAKDSFNKGVTQLAQGRDVDLGAIGQFIAQNQASVGAQRGGLDSILGQLGSITDVAQLESLRNQLDNQLREAQTGRAGLQSQASYMNQLNAAVPQSNRVAGIQSSLQNVLTSQVPTALKRQIGSQLLANSGLSPQEIEELMGGFNLQLDRDDTQQIAQ